MPTHKIKCDGRSYKAIGGRKKIIECRRAVTRFLEIRRGDFLEISNVDDKNSPAIVAQIECVERYDNVAQLLAAVKLANVFPWLERNDQAEHEFLQYWTPNEMSIGIVAITVKVV